MASWTWLALLGCGGDTIDSAASADDTATAPTRACDATHPRVGQVAELATHHHDTAGTATILDDCTVQVTGFTYDGTGLDVRFYGALGEDWASGFAMTDDLRRDGGYADETLTFSVPPEQTLDDLDGLSLWCIDAAVSFGDGVFAAP